MCAYGLTCSCACLGRRHADRTRATLFVDCLFTIQGKLNSRILLSMKAGIIGVVTEVSDLIMVTASIHKVHEARVWLQPLSFCLINVATEAIVGNRNENTLSLRYGLASQT